jgi:peptide deformylase
MKLIVYPDQRLTTRSVECEPNEVTPATILGMQDLIKREQGLALAACQVGILKRFFVLVNNQSWLRQYVNGGQAGERADVPLVWVNPVILASLMPAMIKESCLSLPGVVAQNKRFTALRVQFTTVTGEQVAMNVHGILAVVVQHELDHLDGKLFVDQLRPFERSKADRAINKLRRR